MWLRNGLEQMMCLKPVDFDEIRRFQRILKRILDQNRMKGLWGLQGVMGEIVWNLLEKH